MMLPVAEAREKILEVFEPLAAETVSLSQAAGRVLAEDLASRRTQPPKNMSAMDGFALKASDLALTPATLKVVAEVPAGSSYDRELQAGEAVRIFTGAPLPQGADCIVIQEDATLSGDKVTIADAVKAGAYVRPAGLDFREGEVKLKAGTRLSARDIGLAAAMNCPWLKVRRRPRIALLATGDEIVMPGEAIGENQIVSSNVLALAALIEEAGGEAVNLGIAPDREDGLVSLLQGARGCDLLVTTGGASVGKHDLVQGALASQGLDLAFWKIAMRPGKPLMFGRWADLPVLGLPGNPVSSLVCSYLFLLPIFAKLLDCPALAPKPRQATLGADMKENDRREDYLRAHLDEDQQGRLTALPFAKQDSSMLATLKDADGLLIRPPHAPAAKAGEPCQVIPLRGLSGRSL
jgi:molybdopterin molybdotransferase